MRVLWIATKAPLPAIDGGRLVCAATLDALAAAGVDVTLVAPAPAGDRVDGARRGLRTVLVDARPRRWVAAAARSVRSGLPMTIERHALDAVSARVAELVAREAFDVVHVEQVQAWMNAAPARRAGAACVLRAQNIESAVWAAATNAVQRVEARRLQRFEAAAVAAADVTIALSPSDAAHLAALDASARIIAIAPPAPLAVAAQAAAAVPLARAVGSSVTVSPRLSVASSVRRPGPSEGVFLLAGEPPFVWIGSPGWPPNDEAMRWLVEEIWPVMSARLPRARLHVFGGVWRRGVDARNRTLTWHAAPDDSRKAFASNAILLLPLRTAVGVRMRLLEAWARHVPVIASPAAVDGLDSADGSDVLIAADPAGFAAAAARLAADADLRARLTRGGRATLARRHDPAAVADATIAAYREAIDRRRSRSRPR